MQKKLFDDIVGEDAVTVKDRPVNRVAFVLDHSGSMSGISKKSMWSFNEQIQSLKKESKDQDTYVTLVTFNDNVNVTYSNKPLDEVKELIKYSACGMTALYDAIAVTISSLKMNMKPDGDEAALVFIITDGYENSSKEHRGEEGRKQIKGYIKKLEDDGNWTFIFLGANIDVEAVAKGMSFASANSRSFGANDQGVAVYTASVGEGISDYYALRSKGETQTKDFFSGSSDDTKASKASKASGTAGSSSILGGTSGGTT